MKETTIKIPIFGAEIILIYGTYEEIHNEVEETYPDLVGEMNNFDGRYWVIEQGETITRYLIICNGYKVGIIYHESLHAAYDILHTCRVVIDATNDEPLAYLMEYIAERILEELKIMDHG